MHLNRKRAVYTAGFVVAALALAACSSGGGTDSASSDTSDLKIGSIDLKAAGCPANVVIQTDWNPEAEHGHLYELLGPDPKIDSDKKSVSGPLFASGSYTGVNVEIRSGGPAIGFQTVTSQMYSDTDITMGYVGTDESFQLSADFPTTAVFAPLDVSPQMIMWDPATYPDVKTIADLGKALKSDGGVVRYFGGAAYMEYLMGAGILDPSVVDGSYDGTPANFVASGGKDAQQGFASAEPYLYQNEVADWKKKVAYQLVDAAGYPTYASAMSVRAGDLDGLSGCLTALVPVLQQAEVDYFGDPTDVNALILNLVDQFDTGWTYDQGEADYSVKTMLGDKIVGNGDNDTMGDMAEERVQKIIDLDTPIFAKADVVPAEGIKTSDLYTNKFIDTSIGF
jgi:hypothetical protein